MTTEDSGTEVVPPGRRARRQQEIRQRLLAAGRAIFSQYGVAEATIAQITQHADIGFGTFYLYFPTKEALYRAVVQHGFAQLGTRIDTVLQGLTTGGASWRITVDAGVAAVFNFASEQRDLFALMFIGPDQGSVGIGGEVRARLQEWATTVVHAAAAAECGIKAPVDEDLLDVLTAAVIATLRRSTVRWMRAHLDETSTGPNLPVELIPRRIGAFICAGLAAAICPDENGASAEQAGEG